MPLWNYFLLIETNVFLFLRLRHARFFLLFAILLSMAIYSHAQATKNIVALYSSHSAVYKKALKEFQNHVQNKAGSSFLTSSFVVPSSPDNTKTLLQTIDQKKPDVVLAIGGRAAAYAKKNIAQVPVVYCLVNDPDSIAISGPGAILDIPPDKQVQFIRKAFPDISKIGVIYKKNQNKLIIRELRKLIQAGDDKIVLREIKSLEEFGFTLDSLSLEADCLLLVPNIEMYNSTTLPHILKMLINKGFPAIGFSAAIVKAGTLGGTYADMKENMRFAGDSVLHVLSDKNKANMPFYRPQKIHFGINKGIASLLKVRLNSQELKKADFVIE